MNNYRLVNIRRLNMYNRAVVNYNQAWIVGQKICRLIKKGGVIQCPARFNFRWGKGGLLKVLKQIIIYSNHFHLFMFQLMFNITYYEWFNC